MQILSVRAENFKGLKLVEITPNATTTVVGGRNRMGKSSLLDAIAATLGGAKLCPKKPIRDGQEEAQCEIQLNGDAKRMLPPCTVVRTWRRRENGSIKSQLEITTEDDYRAPTPQKILDDVVGPLGFDPERFLRMKPKEQAEVLRGLVGLDFSELDRERDKIYAQRTAVNANGKAMKVRFDEMGHFPEAPEEELSVSDLIAEMNRRRAVNRDNAKQRKMVTDLELMVEDGEMLLSRESGELDAARERVKELEANVAKLQEQVESAVAARMAKEKEVAALEDEDEDEVQRQIAESEDVNRQVRANALRAQAELDLKAERKKSADLTNQIKSIDDEKQKAREAAEWPVEGLGYTEDGVTLLERPFEQASSTEQREAAFSIVAALNPSLKFAMIKDGSLLDEESLADFARIAAEKGFQLFVERVGEGEECSIVIADGEVQE